MILSNSTRVFLATVVGRKCLNMAATFLVCSTIEPSRLKVVERLMTERPNCCLYCLKANPSESREVTEVGSGRGTAKR